MKKILCKNGRNSAGEFFVEKVNRVKPWPELPIREKIRYFDVDAEVFFQLAIKNAINLPGDAKLVTIDKIVDRHQTPTWPIVFRFYFTSEEFAEFPEGAAIPLHQPIISAEVGK